MAVGTASGATPQATASAPATLTAQPTLGSGSPSRSRYALLNGVLRDLDPLDADDFDPIDYVNAIFPNEQSFATVDHVQAKLEAKIRRLDKTVRDLLKEQAEGESADGGRRELEAALAAVQKLYSEIRAIKEKARHAEQTVHHITKDIKSLDGAKKNLTMSITVLRRLQMLVSAMDQLRAAVTKRQYREVTPLLQAIGELALHFQSFRTVKQVSDLLDSVTSIKGDIKRLIFSEFEGCFSQQGAFAGSADTLNAACVVVDVLGTETKTHLLDWYCEMQLREYISIFRNSEEVGSLDNIARRYAWLKRVCKTFDEEHAPIFPTTWAVSKLLCQRFCSLTKEDVDGLLQKTQLDVKLVVKSLQITLEFESGLNRRFTVLRGEPGTAGAVAETPTLFSGTISLCFEPHLKFFIEAEDKTLAEMMEKFRQAVAAPEEDNGVFKASTDLFIFYRQTLVSMAKFSTRKPFLELCKLFAKYLLIFSDTLGAKIPREEKRTVSTSELQTTCLVLNTAEYCQATISQLEDKIKEKIDGEYKESVTFARERETFLMLLTNSIQALVRQLNSLLIGAFQAMGKIPWSSLQTVGDQSEYVTQIASIVSTGMITIRKSVTNPKHLRWFCDKFVDSFIPTFVKNIHQCKPISEVGAEQLLLDVHAVKSVLLEMPNMGAEPKGNLPAAYTKFVIKSIGKVETLLKVVLAPLDPPEIIIQNYLLLNEDQDVAAAAAGGDAGKAAADALTPQKLQEFRDGFIKILDLKGVKRTDYPRLIELLGARLGRPLPPAVASTTASSMAGAVPTAAAAAAMSSNVAAKLAQAGNTSAEVMKNATADAGVKINENFKKFAAAMEIKGTWLNKSGGKP